MTNKYIHSILFCPAVMIIDFYNLAIKQIEEKIVNNVDIMIWKQK